MADSASPQPAQPTQAAQAAQAADVATAMAALADLPLAPGRNEISGPLLADWVKAANELSKKMSAAEYQQLLPATVFVHAAGDDEV
jgi:hypothetical protein